jgi:hypothetical protein
MANKPSNAPTEAAPDELDPELIKLPRPKTRIRPIMAMAIIGICLTIGLRLSSDLFFSRLGNPVAVDSVASLNSDHENLFVKLRVRPDRTQALRIVPSRSSSGQVLVPTLGTGGALWLLLPPTAWNAEGATNEVYQGRVSRLADMNFHDTLKGHVAKGTIAMRPIALAEVRKALGAKTLEVADVSGDRFLLQATTKIQIAETAINRVRILAVATDPYQDEASWSLALQSAGILPSETAPVSSTTTSWTFDVPAPLGAKDITAKLRAAKLHAAQAAEIRSTRTGSWSELGIDGEDIILGNAKPGFRTQSVLVSAPPLVANGAFLLDTTEKPGTYWYVIIIILALAAFAMLFASALLQTIRRR